MHQPWKFAAALAILCGSTQAAIAATAPASAPKPAAAGPTAPAATAAPVAKPSGPSDRARIEALEKGFAAAFNAKDVKKIMSYYTHQGLFVFDVTPPRQYVGWDAYKKDWEDLMAAFPGALSMEVAEQSITVVGPVAYGHNVQISHFTAKDGSKVDLTVRVTDVYRKSAGKWLIVQEHVSIPVDLATLKPDPLSKP